MQDIFRKYPQEYEGIIPTLCSNLDDLDEPDAKASLVWILGEYAEKIDNSEELLASFLDGFVEEPYQVQFQILVAIVKLFLKKPDGAAQDVVQRVLELATKEADNPDLRDRAFIYWRLLSSSDSNAGKVRVVPLFEDGCCLSKHFLILLTLIPSFFVPVCRSSPTSTYLYPFDVSLSCPSG